MIAFGRVFMTLHPPRIPLATHERCCPQLDFFPTHRHDSAWPVVSTTQVTMKSRRVYVSLTICLLVLASCAHSPPRVDEFEAAIGRATQDELARRFGYPQRLKKLARGTEAWDYEFLAGRSRCVGYRVFFDEERRSTNWESMPCRSEQ
jgi:hypothetical protein